MLRCGDDSLYAGYTVDLARRLGLHQAGKGARYTRSRRPVAIVAAWSYDEAKAARRAERLLKLLPRADKLRLVDASASPELLGRVIGSGNRVVGDGKRVGSDDIPQLAST